VTHTQAVLVKLASSDPPKSRLPSHIKYTMRSTLEKAWRSEWRDSLQGVTTRSFFPSPHCFIQLKIINLPHQVIQILTGHSLLNAHQYFLKNVTLPSCKCSFPSESAQHFIFDCPIYALTRTTLISLCTSEFGHWPPPPSLRFTNPKKFLTHYALLLSDRNDYPFHPKENVSKTQYKL